MRAALEKSLNGINYSSGKIKDEIMKSIETMSLSNKEKLDVLLVHPGNLKAVYQSAASEFAAIEMPVLAALFASYLREKKLSVDILDAPAFDLSPMGAAELIAQRFSPSLVVVVVYGQQPSASTQAMPAAGELCRALKNLVPDIKIMMTGTHPAALPRKTLEEEEIDFVCDREGPDTIYGVAKIIKTGKGDLSTVPSLWFKDKQTLVQTSPGALIDDLDKAMPHMALDLLPMDRYRAHNWHCFEHIHQRQPYASLYTTLGCPYKCSFCCINAPFGKSSYRMWSPEWTIRQIDVLVNQYGVKNIKFVDEMFVLNRKHVIGICDHIIERGYDLNIWAYARVDTIKDGFLDKLKLAGFRWLALGIESGSKHVRDGVEKGRFGGSDIIKVVRDIQDHGINVIGNFIFGLPDDTLTSMQETLDLAIEANCEFANFYTAMAYPGSKLYNEAIANGWDLPDTYIGYSQHSYETKPLPTETLSSAEVLRFRDQAFTTYFTNPRYLEMIESRFGMDVLKHINRMLDLKLRRQLLDT